MIYVAAQFIAPRRISLGLSRLVSGHLRRQCHRERRALARGAFNLDPAAVGVDDPVGNVETDTEAVGDVAGLGVQPAIAGEDLRQLIGRNADALILHGKSNAAVCVLPDADGDLATIRTVVDGVC